MHAALLMMLQAGASSPIPSDFDLATLPLERRPDLSATLRCRPEAPGEDEEIVVCARRPKNQDYPVDPDADYAQRPIRAEKALGGGATAGVYVDSVEMPGGQVSKRLTVGIKVPF
jgi:hypothetical protein